jgi:hypothetical protein
MITAAELGQLISTQPAKPPKPLGNSPRAGYWREYHAHRQAADPAYRARRIEAARKHRERAGNTTERQA